MSGPAAPVPPFLSHWGWELVEQLGREQDLMLGKGGQSKGTAQRWAEVNGDLDL